MFGHNYKLTSPTNTYTKIYLTVPRRNSYKPKDTPLLPLEHIVFVSHEGNGLIGKHIHPKNVSQGIKYTERYITFAMGNT